MNAAKQNTAAAFELEVGRAPVVVVRDAASASTVPPPPSTRRRMRIQTLPGLGDADGYRASLIAIDGAEFAAVDELLAHSLDGFDLD